MTAEELKLEYTEKAQNIIAEGTKKLEDLWKDYDRKIEELQKELYGRWKPEYGENYYCINALGAIECNTYKDESIDEKFYNFHNMFKTVEEAEFKAERWKVIRELEMLADDDKVWNGLNDHYTINHIVDYHGVVLRVDNYNFLSDKTHPFYFKSKESAQKAIEIIGEDRLKKYWLEIKEESDNDN